MRSPHPTRQSRPRHKRGFALLITVTLLAFLVLLLVSLASLTRVETQVASNNQQLAQARQNALMALNIALGELQKYAGPDQRTTARSDMMNTVLPGPVYTAPSSRWLGVYGRAVATADTTARDLYADIPSKISTDTTTNSDTSGNQAQRLNWLVSGNEGTAFDPSTAVDPNGQIARYSPTFAFAPTDPVALGGGTALSTDVTVKNLPARLLVGPGSVSATVDYVAAPLKSISAVAPGQGTTPVTIGNYAWWVGDEGAKARLNLRLTATTAPEKANAFVSSQRAAIELMDGTHPNGTTTSATADLIGYNSAYTPSQSNLPNIINVGQLPMLTPASSAALSTAVKYRLHDLTGYSTSILSDTYAGGLKKDLSAILAVNPSPSPANTAYLFTPEPTSGTNNKNEFGMPTWGQLRSFVQTTATTAGLSMRAPSMAASSNPSIPAPTDVGIYPVMSYCALGLQYIAPLGDQTVGNPIQLALLPVVVLWNPYTVPLFGDCEFGIRKAYSGFIQLQGKDATNPAAWGPGNILESIDLGNVGATAAGGTNSTGLGPYFRFKISVPSTGIPPGQSLVFTLSANAALYSSGNNVLVCTTYKPLNYVLLPAKSFIGVTPSASANNTTPKNTPTQIGGIYRVGVNAITYNGISPTMWNAPGFSSVYGNMGGAGNGTHEAYLGAVSSTSPSGNLPWTGAAFASRNWYQSMTLIGAPFSPTPPYGNSSGGYAASSAANGLLQGENQLASTVSAPAGRMIVINNFSNIRPSNNGRSRWIVNGNARALMSTQGGAGNFVGRPNQSTWPPDLSPQPVGGFYRASSGTHLGDISFPPVDATLFEFRPASLPLLTLGQLQHANLGWNGGEPAYAIGNSNNGDAANPGRLVTLGPASGNEPGNYYTAKYGTSWLLNRALWDKYLISTVPHEGTGGTTTNTNLSSNSDIPDSLPNTRLIIQTNTNANFYSWLSDPDRAAAHLLLAGGFNINSTSEQAWRAVLGASNQLAHDPTDLNVGGSAWSKAIFSRFSKPTTNSTSNAWQGYRQLNEAQISQLAANIVAEIRKRGPFVSLADFVNRRLHPLPTTTPYQLNDPRLKGTIQAAIDTTTTGSTAINDSAQAPFRATDYPVTPFFNSVASINEFSSGSNVLYDGTTTYAPPMPYGSSAAFAPQFLTQADVLSSIGSSLSARSDTFTVRTYGEAVNPSLSSTDAGYIAGRAWCEAVIQRVPEYVDAVNDPNAHLAPSQAINKNFGRRFKIISFRWLSSNDI